MRIYSAGRVPAHEGFTSLAGSYVGYLRMREWGVKKTHAGLRRKQDIANLPKKKHGTDFVIANSEHPKNVLCRKYNP